jgi:HNH endonuclease
MNKYIRIRWRWPKTITTETIHAALGPDPKDGEISGTSEYWPNLKRTVFYNTTSERRINGDGSQQISIHYSQEMNSDLLNDHDLLREWGEEPATWAWGTSIITISAGLNSASAEWKCDNHKYDCNAPCTVLSEERFEERERESVDMIKRKQDKFEKLLLEQYVCCAITCEDTEKALDATHIIAVSANGLDLLSNGILLRADIHRLYDAGLF